MNYYYDINLSFNEEPQMFYEMKDEKIYKKIPIIFVNSKTFKDIWLNNIEVTKDFLKKIEIDNKYYTLIADKNSVVACEFTNNGTLIKRSSLNIIDELNILELIYTLNITKIDYKILNKVKYRNNLVIEDSIKEVINEEIDKLVSNNEWEKIKYLYMEWFSKVESDKDKMIKSMKSKINKEIKEEEIKIYNIIKLSYNKV